MKEVRLNYSVITNIIENGAKVLDLGCGDGTLLEMLVNQKHVKAKGIEIDQKSAISCLEKGLSVIQGDIDEGLKQFADKEYDYVILNQTLQSTDKPDFVIKEMLRVAKKVVVSFPNFAYWKVRLYLLFNGRMPKSKMLPFEWFDTPNIHLLTIQDFFDFTKKNNIKILNSIYLTSSNTRARMPFKFMTNLFSEEVIFVLTS